MRRLKYLKTLRSLSSRVFHRHRIHHFIHLNAFFRIYINHHLIHLDASTHTFECVIWHIWMRYVVSSSHTFNRHRIRHVTFECGVSQMSIVDWHLLIHLNASSQTFECVTLYRPHIHFIIIAYTILYISMWYVVYILIVISYIWMRHLNDLNALCRMFECVACINRWQVIHMVVRHGGCEDDVANWPRHVTCMNESCHTYERVMSHVEMSHITRMNELDHTYECVMSHIWTSHATRMNESCHTLRWVMSHEWMSDVTHMNESCHTYERVIPHVWTSPGTRWHESCLKWVMSVTLDWVNITSLNMLTVTSMSHRLIPTWQSQCHNTIRSLWICLLWICLCLL